MYMLLLDALPCLGPGNCILGGGSGYTLITAYSSLLTPFTPFTPFTPPFLPSFQAKATAPNNNNNNNNNNDSALHSRRRKESDSEPITSLGSLQPPTAMAPPSPSKPGPLSSHPVTSVDPSASSGIRAARDSRPGTDTGPRSPVLKSRSRFHEGSMNDRTSSIPPISFLGPEEEAFERRMRLDYPGRPSQNTSYERGASSLDSSHTLSPQPQPPHLGGGPRPVSAAGHYVGNKKGFWGGLREKLSFSRDKSTGGLKRPASLDAKANPAGAASVSVSVSAAAAAAAAANTNAAGLASEMRGVSTMPSKEEVAASYQKLMRDGFFSSHAIPSARQPPPPGISVPSTPTSMHPPTGASFAARMAIHDTNGNWGLPRQSPLPPIPSPLQSQSQSGRGDGYGGGYGDGYGDGDQMSSPSRGTKRGHADGDDDTSLSFKKLRKSASRISSELPFPGLRKQRSRQAVQSPNNSRPSDSSAAHAHAHAAAVAAMPPPPTPFGIQVRRTFSSSSGRETNRLAKRPQSSGRGRAPPSGDPSLAASGPDTRMSIDSGAPSFDSIATTASTSRDEMRGSTVGFINSSHAAFSDSMRWARPARRNNNNNSNNSNNQGTTTGLRVRPDTNRGVPTVPRVPDQFKMRSGGGAENQVSDVHPPFYQQQQVQGEGHGHGQGCESRSPPSWSLGVYFGFPPAFFGLAIRALLIRKWFIFGAHDRSRTRDGRDYVGLLDDDQTVSRSGPLRKQWERETASPFRFKDDRNVMATERNASFPPDWKKINENA
ncbi:hypothetical protein SODALDRAFT_356274 [Sodiomyces alkalinus F11]|uniref:Uncharacterized protein n=1 Tax=Sodiomyces alkalinus (strain CBS 110278 / VKM F-3762 / F11) TaxID=1314773 RepID=A0A3N2Q0L0_SODAK|nr:hypothetical protein SODALDRAFT_356274 [Sodiomyces alkalinus F11]ROT40304.1 hypothetical protein SODALDRAFT_356274 [Sodiomyces alkalinus F11]